MAVTYTNFSGSAVSAIATGGIIEIAGSTYQFTETAITYTGAGSTASDLYIYVKPDAVVSTASVVAWGSAPVWVDAKQGFYASAASITRCIGGMYVGTVATYYNKYLYTSEILNYCLQNNATRPFLKKTVNIGEWNMDATTTVTIVHGFGSLWKKIKNIEAVIIDDDDTFHSPLNTYWATDHDIQGGVTQWYANAVMLSRAPATSYFDNPTFNGTASTVPNRGWIYITYEA